MGVYLTTLTNKPVQYSTFSFGGDDTQLGKSGLFGRIAEWDRNAKEDCFKANVVFLLKRAFDFLDALCIGACLFGIGGFHGKLDESEYYQTGLDRNREAREKVIHALGGAEVCRRIPCANLNAEDFTDYLKLGDQYFQGGQWIVQGEDLAGRKFISMRLVDRMGNVHIATAHQRYRETCIRQGFGDGSSWTLGFEQENVYPSIVNNPDAVATFIEKVRTLRHEQFSIAPKP